MAILIVALDLPSLESALGLVDRVGDAVDHYKVGSELFTRAGPGVIRELREREKRVFLDLKFHDIPNTVARGVEAAAGLGVDMLTLHASGGSAMMRAAREAVGADGPKLIGVTLLTSISASDLEEIWGKELRSLREEVSRLAGLAAESGLDGIVTSPLEVEGLRRRHGPDFITVTPGIRPAGAGAGDQARVATPAFAVRAGADYLVIGRPVLEAPDPADAVARIAEEMAGTAEAQA